MSTCTDVCAIFRVHDLTHVKDEYLSNVVKVPMSHSFLRRQLSDLVEEHVELELGAEVAQAPVTKTLERTVGYECTQQVHIGDELLQLGTGEFHPLAGSHDSEDALLEDERVRGQLWRE